MFCYHQESYSDIQLANFAINIMNGYLRGALLSRGKYEFATDLFTNLYCLIYVITPMGALWDTGSEKSRAILKSEINFLRYLKRNKNRLIRLIQER